MQIYSGHLILTDNLLGIEQENNCFCKKKKKKKKGI